MDKYLTQYEINQITGKVVFAGPDVFADSEKEAQIKADNLSCYFNNCKLKVIGKFVEEIEVINFETSLN